MRRNKKSDYTGKIIPEEIPKTVAPTAVKSTSMEYAVANFQAIGRREGQEDSFAFGNALDDEAVSKKGLLIVVADGMGGMSNGKLASETATASILGSFESFDVSSDISEQLYNAVLLAGKKVAKALDGSGGSTLVTGVVYDERLYMASVGDSYIFLLRNRQLVRLNRSQNVLNREYLDVISDDGFDGTAAKRHPEKDAVTQFLGMPELDEVDYFKRPLKLTAGDVLLFCSDGVGGVINEKKLADCLSFGRPEDMCAAMNKEILAVNSKYQDNYTALVIQCRK